jgi:hypothetical protein
MQFRVRVDACCQTSDASFVAFRPRILEPELSHVRKLLVKKVSWCVWICHPFLPAVSGEDWKKKNHIELPTPVCPAIGGKLSRKDFTGIFCSEIP